MSSTSTVESSTPFHTNSFTELKPLKPSQSGCEETSFNDKGILVLTPRNKRSECYYKPEMNGKNEEMDNIENMKNSANNKKDSHIVSMFETHVLKSTMSIDSSRSLEDYVSDSCKQLTVQTEPDFKKHQKQFCNFSRYCWLKLLVAVFIAAAMIAPTILCFLMYKNSTAKDNNTTTQPLQGEQHTGSPEQNVDLATFSLDVHDDRLGGNNNELFRIKWENSINNFVDFHENNNTFSLRKSGLYYLSLSLNIGTNFNQSSTHSLLCIHFGLNKKETCKRVSFVPNIEIPVHIPVIRKLDSWDQVWVSISNKNLLYRSSDMNTFTVWRI